MLINVIYRDGSIDIVNSSSLAHLIKKKEIFAFCRSDGWTRVDQDPVRREKRPFGGPGKRVSDLRDNYCG